MSAERQARPDVAEMGGAPLPRTSGELVFHDDWERRAFALAVEPGGKGPVEWQESQQQLIASVGEAERNDLHHPTRGYYESWLVSLERLLERKRLLKD